jgi:hypothetical protein
VKLTIHTLGDGRYSIADIDQDTVMDMVDALGDADAHVMAFEMDDAQVYLNKVNIISIEVE